MQTAMKELIEYLEKAYYVKEIIDWEEYKVELLEKEKEQIIDAWDKRGSTIVPRYFLEENITGEEYYNQTYNQLPNQSKTLLQILDLQNEKNIINDILEKPQKDE